VFWRDPYFMLDHQFRESPAIDEDDLLMQSQGVIAGVVMERARRNKDSFVCLFPGERTDKILDLRSADVSVPAFGGLR
jgi:hypothetical protein